MPDAEGQVWNYSDAALTHEGRARASQLAATLAGAGVEAIFTSPIPRARETAETIAGATALPITADGRLREVDIGDFEGITLSKLRETDQRFLPWLEVYFGGRHAGPDFHVPAELAWPGGESVADALRRALPAFCAIAAAWQGRTVAICTHAYVLQAFLCHVVGADVAQYWSFAGLPASLTLAEVSPDGRGVLRTLNGDTELPSFAGGRLALRERTVPDGAPDLRSTSRIFLIRHGQSMVVEDGEPVYSHNPIGLTRQGAQQAEELAAELATVRLNAVYTSDLNRARETAEPLAAAQGLVPIVRPELREIALGDFEGMTLARIPAADERFTPWLDVAFNERFPSVEYHHPVDLAFPGGESVVDVYQRVIEPFLQIVRDHLGETVALVSHAWVIQPLLCHILGASLTDYFRLQLRYALPTLVEVDGNGQGVLETFNRGTSVALAPPAESRVAP
ncbi:hypothetical protein PSU4_58680 [Pseudonocardia sulfidoxydans NBRC 16205]|uniref:Phosphoglycerate mutase n=2 Tax=Pseudonocardia sulfidoxydans TaxID=54011 RepID=A0A511DT29_9PSEU|nr:hypothetical protein PSU4_58680 [Pseudonocardia sulfidoxydans NBRC 16205]